MPETRKLANSAKTALRPLAEWLEGASFHKFGDYDVCSDNRTLADKSLKFIQEFARTSQRGSGSRITAMRFTGQAILPVKNNTSVVLIPVQTISGSPAIGEGGAKTPFAVGDFATLTENTLVEPAFYALLLLDS